MFDGKNLNSFKKLITKLCSYFTELSDKGSDEIVIREYVKKVLKKDTCRFAEQLKLARLRKEMSQQAISFSLGITQATYSLIETGKRNPSIAVFKECAVILGVDPSDLIHVNDDIPTKSNAIPILDPSFFRGKYVEFHRNIDIHKNRLNFYRIPDSSNESYAFKIQGDLVNDLEIRAGRRMPVITGSLALCTCSGLDYCTNREEIYSLADNRLCIVTITGQDAMLQEVHYENHVLKLIPWSNFAPVYEFPTSLEFADHVSARGRMKFHQFDITASSVEIFGFVTKIVTEISLIGLR